MSRVCNILIILPLILAPIAVPAQVIEQQKKTVVFVFGETHPRSTNGAPMMGSNGRPLVLNSAIGTGFFVSFPDKRGGENFGFMYLVTAKHVLKDSDGSFLPSVSLRLSLKQPINGQSYEFGRVPVTDEHGNLIWLDDPDNPASDVAILPFLPDQSKYDYMTIPTELFLTKDVAREKHFAEGDSLYFVGLLPQYYGEKKNYPVVRKGSVALISDELLDTPTGKQNAYVAEIGAWPGNSGSPVFVNLGGMREGNLMIGEVFAFVGILEGYYENVLRGETVETAQMFWGNPSNIGISFVVPADTVLHVLQSKKAQDLRDAELKKKGLLK